MIEISGFYLLVHSVLYLMSQINPCVIFFSV